MNIQLGNKPVEKPPIVLAKLEVTCEGSSAYLTHALTNATFHPQSQIRASACNNFTTKMRTRTQSALFEVRDFKHDDRPTRFRPLAISQHNTVNFIAPGLSHLPDSQLPLLELEVPILSCYLLDVVARCCFTTDFPMYVVM